MQGQTRGSTWAVKYRKCFLLHILSHVFLYVLFPVGFPGSSVAKNLPANSRDRGLIPGSGRSSEEGNGTHANILAWEIPWTEEPGGLQPMGSQKSWM